MNDDCINGVVYTPKNEMPRIDTLWAFLSVDPRDGNEGVCAAPALFGGHAVGMAPMIAADEARVESLRNVARALAAQSGMSIKLVRFDVRTEVEEFKPCTRHNRCSCS